MVCYCILCQYVEAKCWKCCVISFSGWQWIFYNAVQAWQLCYVMLLLVWFCQQHWSCVPHQLFKLTIINLHCYKVSNYEQNYFCACSTQTKSVNIAVVQTTEFNKIKNVFHLLWFCICWKNHSCSIQILFLQQWCHTCHYSVIGILVYWWCLPDCVGSTSAY